MKLGAIVLVWLSTDGYWFGGSKATIGSQWAAGDVMPPAALAWRLQAADITLAEGQRPLPADGSASQTEMVLPSVRVPIEAHLIWRVDRIAKKEAMRPSLAEGKLTAHLYPSSLLQGRASLLAGKQVVVWDDRNALPTVLKKAKINVRVVNDESELAFTRPDVLIVAAGRLTGRSNVYAQERLTNLAAAGSNVLVLAQSGSVAANGTESNARQLLGYSLTLRQLPPKLEWREDHPLARLLRLLEKPESTSLAWAIRVPASNPALEIAWWPPEVMGLDPVTTDALVVTKAVQKGRITMCQLPLGPWQSDPRSQLFLADAIDYLVSPVVPTPPMNKRLALQR